MTEKTELEGLMALSLLAIVVLVWLAIEIRDLHADVQPILDSRVVRALS